MVQLTRRAFVSSSSAIGAGAVLPASLLFATPAHAIDPVTVVMVAQAGVQLYRMFKGSGPGVADLLRAQTQMLKAISDQITVVDARLRVIHADIQQLKDAVAQLPKDTIRELYLSEISGAFGLAAELNRAFADHLGSRGRAFAVTAVRNETLSVLARLRGARSSLFTNESLAVVPTVCAAWYVEQQLMLNLLDYDAPRLSAAAEVYRAAFARWVPLIDAQLEYIERQADEFMAFQTTATKYDNVVCYTGVNRKSENGYGHQGDYRWDTFNVWGTNWSLQSAAETATPELADLSSAIAALRGAGVAIPAAITDLAPRSWTATPKQESWSARVVDDENGPASKQYYALYHSMSAAACKIGSPDKVAATENARAQPIQILRLSAATHYAFKLCCGEALKSADRVLAAVRPQLTETTRA